MFVAGGVSNPQLRGVHTKDGGASRWAVISSICSAEVTTTLISDSAHHHCASQWWVFVGSPLVLVEGRCSPCCQRCGRAVAGLLSFSILVPMSVVCLNLFGPGWRVTSKSRVQIVPVVQRIAFSRADISSYRVVVKSERTRGK